MKIKQGSPGSGKATAQFRTNITKTSDTWIITGDVEMVQHIRPINKSGSQDIFSLWIKEDKFKYAHKKSCVIYSPWEAF